MKVSRRGAWPVIVTFAILLTLCQESSCYGWLQNASESKRKAKKPNIIVIMADDMGYGDVSCYGATEIKTPNIDRLASEGIRFTDGYCSASTCTPTRFSFLTGKYAFRQKGTGIAPPSAPTIIKPGTETIASLLKKGGYETSVIGKWHLGLGAKTGPDWNGLLKPGPLEIGFDHCFLLPTTNDRVPQVYVENHRVLNLDPKDPLWVGKKKPSKDHKTGKTHRSELKMDWSHGHNSTIHNGISRIGFYTGGKTARFRDEDLADRWVKESEKFIKANKEKPFFLFFASHDLHVPRMPHERFQGKSKLGFRGDSILQLDWCVGRLMEILKENNLDEDTLVVFCSDNGPVADDGYKDGAIEKMGKHRPGGHFSGGKYSVLEGGTRTPFIVRWKGNVKPAVSEEVVCTIDLPATAAAIAGVKVPEKACPDSFDLTAAILGKKGGKGRAELVQQDNGKRGNYGFRSGDWKLVRHDSGRSYNYQVNQKLKTKKVERFGLFNLREDPKESIDLKKKFPKKFQQLKNRLQEIIQNGSKPSKKKLGRPTEN